MLQASLSSSVESNSQASTAIPLGEPQRVPPSHSQPPPVTDPRDTAEYKAALELELWKEQQEEMFQAQVNTTDYYICVLKPVSRKTRERFGPEKPRERFGPEKPIVKLQSTCFNKKS